MNNVQRIALTAGEPAGIGPDLCIELAQQQSACQLIVIADPDLLKQRAQLLGLPIRLIDFDQAAIAEPAPAGSLYCSAVQVRASVVAGQLNAQNASYVLNTLQTAASGCLNKQFDGVVTAPVHKGVINQAEFAFSGHTEFFAEHAGVEKVVMMLATPTLRVALATTHLPLRAVSDALNQTELAAIIRIINISLKTQFGLNTPRIAICGLNPHAGEGGYLGREEIDVITPVIAQMRAEGVDATGPWPADTIFVKKRLEHYDVILAMFHDQGLPVLKHQGFGEAVNITLGLPYIRTSVDHGTALELAGSGKADMSSLQAAVKMAQSMAQHRQ